MKHKKSLTFSIFLLPLLLTSCGNPTSLTLSSPTSTQPGSTVDTTPTSKQTDTGAKATTSSTPDEPEDDPDIIKPEDSPWTEEVTASMVQYLGGNILPYIDIGKSIDVSYVSDDANDGYKSYLLLVGNKFVSSNLQDAKDTYISYDWGCMVVNSIFVANSDKIDIDVIVEANKDGLFELRAYWSEKFDDTSVSDWTDEEKEDLAFEIAPKFGIKLQTRPFIKVSVGMPGDHHVRKASINLDKCIKCNLCIPTCPTDAIPQELKIITEKFHLLFQFLFHLLTKTLFSTTYPHQKNDRPSGRPSSYTRVLIVKLLCIT
jgi:NAD-dependent dihydropyrimidine dehydrogenase PreA subunit